MRTVIDLFAGGGGAALGGRMAGLHNVGCVEWDEDARATLTAAGFELVGKDIREVTELPEAWAWWGSPPCQDFSAAGSRAGSEGERNGWPWLFDLLDRTYVPRWGVFENVEGLTHHDSDPHDASVCRGCYLLGTILPKLRQRFRHVQYAVLDAADFGIPQHRRRVIFICGPHPVPWPEPTHGPQPGLFSEAQPWVSLEAALGLLTTGATLFGAGGYDTQRGARGHEPAPAIGTRGNAMLDEGVGRRALSVAECARLQAFPEDWPWSGSVSARHRQVGNANPPGFTAAIWRAVLAADGAPWVTP